MKELVQLCKDIYNTGVWPEDFLQTRLPVLQPLYCIPLSVFDLTSALLFTPAYRLVGWRASTGCSALRRALLAEYPNSAMCPTTCWKPYTGSLSASALCIGLPPWCGDASWALPHPICGTSVVPYRAPRVVAPFAPLRGGCSQSRLPAQLLCKIVLSQWWAQPSGMGCP